MKENIDDWKPFGFVWGKNAYDKNGNRNIFYYDRSWYCQENYILHTSEKQVLNCSICSKKYYKK